MCCVQLPSLTLRPYGLKPTGLSCPWDFSGKFTEVGCHFLLQGISQPRDRTQVSHIASRFFTSWATREVLHRLGGFNNKHLLPIVLAAKSKSKAMANSVSSETPLSGSQMAIILLCPYLAEGTRKFSEISFIRALIPFVKASSSWTNYFPKAPPLSTITLRVKISAYKFGRGT